MVDYTDIVEPRAAIPTDAAPTPVRRSYTPIYLGLLGRNGSFRVYAPHEHENRVKTAVNEIWGQSASVCRLGDSLIATIPMYLASEKREALRQKIYIQ